jgi:hypothetical protein
MDCHDLPFDAFLRFYCGKIEEKFIFRDLEVEAMENENMVQ